MKKILYIIIASISMMAASAKAQIGYQVSLLNTATGEPRAGVTVDANITITDSKGGVVHTSTQRATTNDFGVLSLTVGDADTFKKVDTGKLPLFIAVVVDGTLIGKSQILSVPVAEIANKVASSFTLEDLVGTWKEYKGDGEREVTYIFNTDMTWSFTSIYISDGHINVSTSGFFEIDGNTIWIYRTKNNKDPSSDDGIGGIGYMRYHKGKLHDGEFSSCMYIKQ